MLLSILVTVGLGRPTVPWSIIEVNDEEKTFEGLFESLQAGCFDVVPVSDDLRRARLLKTFVGVKADSLMVASNTQCAVRICSQFGGYVKMSVEINTDHPDPEPAMLPNAFSILMASQRRLQRGDDGLPFPKTVKDGRDRLYNDLLILFREMGVKWNDPEVNGVPLLMCLQKVLWYIDGHYDTIAEKAPNVPAEFARFNGYNCPTAHKHRKRLLSNLCRSDLRDNALALQDKLQCSWFKKESFNKLRVVVEALIISLNSYASYLQEKSKAQRLHNDLMSPSASPSESSHMEYLSKISSTPTSLSPIDDALKNKEVYTPLAVIDFAPSDRRQRYRYIKDIEKGLSVPSILYTYTPGGSILNHTFLWRLPEGLSACDCLSENQQVVAKLMDSLPVYHTRAMKREFINHYGSLLSGTKPYVLRSIYRELTRDATGSRTYDEEQVDRRIKALDSEDFDIIVDMRELNEGRTAKYDEFWDKCTEYLSESSAVPERRHGEVCFMAKAISVRDLIQQVSKRCSPDTHIPSDPWVRLNFSPRNPRAKVADHYRGRLKVKHVIQKRQFRKFHPDQHYCAALFRYQRELAIKFRDISSFVCLDDKHRIKIGEPGYPVAAAERGRQVIVAEADTFVVGDHDYTRFSIIPSVALEVEVPEQFEGSWYSGQVFVGIKDAVHQGSSPLRHATELHSKLITRIGNKTVLFVYSDGGPDHRLTYVSVQLSLIALFLNLNLDCLVACRTAPNHSWKNPVERMMSVINLGIQCVGLMRAKRSDDFEAAICNCNNLQQLRQATNTGKEEVFASLKPAIDLLHGIIKRLELKGRGFDIYEAATEEEMEEFWSVLLLIDATLTESNPTKKTLLTKSDMCAFMKHCCRIRHYSFQVKKCGQTSCSICKPVRMDSKLFESLHYLPDPVPGNDDHYKRFMEVYGSPTTEEHRPSLQSTRKTALQSIGYSPSQQHARNVGMLLQCDECAKWRLLYCKQKLNYPEICELQGLLDDISYSCGVSLSELDLSSRLKKISVRDHRCSDPIEKLYYSCDFDPICYWCASEEISEDPEHFPVCSVCQKQGKSLITRPKRKK